MAVRLKKVKDGFYKALCAAESESMEGDIYLDDSMDEALNAKYYKDFYKMGLLEDLSASSLYNLCKNGYQKI